MIHKQSVYQMGLILHISLIVLLLCCVIFIGCPEGTEMVEDVIQPTPPAVDVVEIPAESVQPSSEPTVTTPEPMPPQPEVVTPLPEGTVVFVEPRQVTSPAIGQQLKVNINVKDAADVIAYEVTVGFDPTALRYVSITNADYLPAGAFAAPPQVSADSIYLATTSVAGSAAAANGTLATVTFEVVAAKASTITLIDVLLSDSNITPLTLQKANSNISAP
ncbi:MAG: cohesin domain-containing protein [Candidatus Poribacteria bacterium]|nr:cohesin domain-containing protein [Candidatus Poribacteria bacterium]